MAARAFNGESKFGRIIDPIADKLLVGLPLCAVAYFSWYMGSPFWLFVTVPVAVIVLRDLTITILRLVAPDGEGARVSKLAKWKTTLELLVVGATILWIAASPFIRWIGAGEGLAAPEEVGIGWLAALAITALLSAWTGAQYLLAPKAPASPQT
jgi:cardiolipin synthase